MGVKERIISIRLIEKTRKRPDVLKEIGVVVNTNFFTEDDINDEKVGISKGELPCSVVCSQ